MNKRNQTIAIHQPNFLPWLGYFYKIAKCDAFIFYDSIQYSKGSYTKRVMIDSKAKSKDYDYISLSIQKHALHTKINEIHIESSEKWLTKLINKIQETYGKSKHYHQVIEILRLFKSLLKADTSLSILNTNLILFICEKLELKSRFYLSSEMDNRGRSTDALIHLIKQMNASHYLSGHGAKKYVDFNLFDQNNIKFHFSDFGEKFKLSDFDQQLFGKSIISYLAHYSYEEIAYFLKE